MARRALCMAGGALVDQLPTPRALRRRCNFSGENSASDRILGQGGDSRLDKGRSVVLPARPGERTEFIVKAYPEPIKKGDPLVQILGLVEVACVCFRAPGRTLYVRYNVS